MTMSCNRPALAEPYRSLERVLTPEWADAVGIPLVEVEPQLDLVRSQEEPWQYMDALKTESPALWRATEALIVNLDPGAIVDVYGVNMLLWASANVRNAARHAEIQDALQETIGDDAQLFGKAIKWCWEQDKTDMADLLPTYDAMSRLASGNLFDSVDLERMLFANTNDGVSISQKRIAKYGLIALQTTVGVEGYADGWNEEVWPSERFHIWLDAPVGFALTYRDRPQAVATLVMEGANRGVFMNQIQGVRAHRTDAERNVIGKISSRGLVVLDWRSCMVEVAENLSSQLGATGVTIQSAANNYWLSHLPPGDEHHKNGGDIAASYDNPAMKREYMPDQDGNWHKPISGAVVGVGA